MTGLLIFQKILLLFLICSCTTRSVRMSYYLSTLENRKEHPLTERESIKVDSLSQRSREFSEKC